MSKIKTRVIKFGEKLFDIEDEPMPRGAWWWWFWMFFFDNPKNPDKPRQLMILWSTKNVKKISCNTLDIKIDKAKTGNVLDGAVAAWYFDGEKMHHNYLLDQCDIKIGKQELSTEEPQTSFAVKGETALVRIGDDIEFVAEPTGKHDFLKPNYHANSFLGSKGYAITKVNHLDLKGTVDRKPITGTAYFQRVFVNAPAVPWYWGSFHFENGAVLTYTNQMVFRKAIKKHIAFFDGKEMHELNDVDVRRSGGKIPTFKVTGETGDKKIAFTVSAYAHSSWTFKKKSLGFIPNKLVYNEYPAVVSDLKFLDRKTGKKLTEKDLGKSVGNAEHTTGYLL